MSSIALTQAKFKPFPKLATVNSNTKSTKSMNSTKPVASWPSIPSLQQQGKQISSNHKVSDAKYLRKLPIPQMLKKFQFKFFKDCKYEPKLVCCEFTDTIPNDVSFVQNRVPGLSQVCSAKSLIEMAKKKITL